jgi:hypothetical protein
MGSCWGKNHVSVGQLWMKQDPESRRTVKHSAWNMHISNGHSQWWGEGRHPASHMSGILMLFTCRSSELPCGEGSFHGSLYACMSYVPLKGQNSPFRISFYSFSNFMRLNHHSSLIAYFHTHRLLTKGMCQSFKWTSQNTRASPKLMLQATPVFSKVLSPVTGRVMHSSRPTSN